MDREQVVALQHQRFAAKKYDPNRRISEKDWEALVEVGRLAPSSIGLEPWKMLLLKNERMKEDLKPMAWGALFGLRERVILSFILRERALLMTAITLRK
ncbi:hypothetical protein HpDR96b_04060 [Helicobacter pylori]